MNRRVLIVDDNLDFAENLAELLESEGFDVKVDDDARHALATIRPGEFDVGLLDIHMPGMDGLALHSHLRRSNPTAQYFMMTAYVADDRLAEARRTGVVDVLPKPLPFDALLRTLRAANVSPER